MEESEQASVTNVPLLLRYAPARLEARLVNMAENVTEALKLFESANGTGDNQESSTVRLVRTACKAFQRRACEESGCPLQFTSYLK